MTTILALDLARVSGWAFGEPGAEPVHGSIQFAAKDASHEAVFYKAMIWSNARIVEFKPTLIVWESPLATSFTRGKTNTDTTTLLYGLPAIVGAMAYQHLIYDVRKADTAKVRHHFINCNPKRAEAKPMAIEQCRVQGWDVEDDNEADALATWSYMCSLLEPKQAVRPLRALRLLHGATPVNGRRPAGVSNELRSSSCTLSWRRKARPRSKLFAEKLFQLSARLSTRQPFRIENSRARSSGRTRAESSIHRKDCLGGDVSPLAPLCRALGATRQCRRLDYCWHPASNS